MSREIKFRAWNPVNKTMITESDDKLVVSFNGLVEHWDGTEYPYFKLMQYTGLKDKNGKEIYESDVLREETAWNSVGALEVYYEDGTWFANRNFPVVLHELLRDGDREVTVIGNIFQDGHLLDEAKNGDLLE